MTSPLVSISKKCPKGCVLRAYWSEELTDIFYGKFFFPKEKEIFHYTDLNGLVGIIKNNGFWLSDAQYLNDSEEIKHGINICLNTIDACIEKEGGNNRGFSNVLTKVRQNIEKHPIKGNYIASFSLASESLSQYRAYAKNGAGVCIAFDSLAKLFLPNQPVPSKVIYNDDTKKECLLFIIDVYCKEYANIVDPDTFDDDGYIDHLTRSLTDTIILFKHESFEVEQEVRILYKVPSKEKRNSPHPIEKKKNYRNSNNMVVPYFCSNDIKSTTIKPSKGTKEEPQEGIPNKLSPQCR